MEPPLLPVSVVVVLMIRVITVVPALSAAAASAVLAAAALETSRSRCIIPPSSSSSEMEEPLLTWLLFLCLRNSSISDIFSSVVLWRWDWKLCRLDDDDDDIGEGVAGAVPIASPIVEGEGETPCFCGG